VGGSGVGEITREFFKNHVKWTFRTSGYGDGVMHLDCRVVTLQQILDECVFAIPDENENEILLS
jgi:hypothetical protein